jgi:DNA-binding transcriptional regulator YhcF (GntR family)
VIDLARPNLMARKKIPRTLSRLPARAHVQKAFHKTERLTEVLRHAAITNQGAQPRPFYPLREISAHFAVPYALVARAYEQLQREGLLTAVRGSRTVLEGQQFDRQISVRAFVGLPASLSAFVTIQAYRMFLSRSGASYE